VRVNPLEHGSLPDSEAVVIRSLLDRIESLEQQVKSLLPQASVSLTSVPNSPSAFPTLNKTSNVAVAEKTELAVGTTCQLKDKAIQEFFDGSGI
jgi:serine O-acetyltransferase